MIKEKILNQITKNGNKFKSEKIFYKSLKKIQKKKKNFKELIKFAIINSSPVFYVKKIKRKRKNSIEFPFILPKLLRISYGLKFLLYNSSSIKDKSFYNNFSLELINSCKKCSNSYRKKESLYKETFIKKKFSNYRWF